jgi:hypothetical protein
MKLIKKCSNCGHIAVCTHGPYKDAPNGDAEHYRTQCTSCRYGVISDTEEGADAAWAKLNADEENE